MTAHSNDTVIGTNANCEECEYRMRALDCSELLRMYNFHPEEEPAGVVIQVGRSDVVQSSRISQLIDVTAGIPVEEEHQSQNDSSLEPTLVCARRI